MNAWAVVVAGGLGGLLGLAGSLGAVLVQQRRLERRSLDGARETAANRLLMHSLALSGRARALLITARTRSGLAEGLMVNLYQRRPIDPQELHDWLMQDVGPLYEAWSAVWTTSTDEAVAAANDLLARCGDVIGAATPSTVTGLARLRRQVFGVGNDKDHDARLLEAVEALGAARRVFATVARAEAGLPPVDLLGSATQQDGKG